MSTAYQQLKPLFSSIRVEDNNYHVRITLWIRGQNVGTLCVGREDKEATLNLFFTNEGREPFADCVLDTTELFHPKNMPDSRQLLSEYYELTTLGELKLKGKRP